MTESIYFIRSPLGRVKIGISCHPSTRLRELQTAHSERLELVGYATGTRYNERRLHHELAAHRLNGEWFDWTPEVESAVGDFLANPAPERAQQNLCVSTSPLIDELAQRIRAARITAMLSQVEAAAELGVSPRTWQGWESGTMPWPRHRRALAAWFARVNGDVESAA